MSAGAGRHAEIRRRLLDPDQGRRPPAHARRRRDVGGRHPRLRAVRRKRVSRRSATGRFSVPRLFGGWLSRLHGRPGRRHGALSGHRGTDRCHARRVRAPLFPPVRTVPRQASTWPSPAPRTGTEGPTGRAGAIMIQRLPPEDAQGSAEGREPVVRDPATREAEEDGWRRAMILMGSAKARELVDPALPPWKLVGPAFPRGGCRDLQAHRAYPPLPLRARTHARSPAHDPACRARDDARDRRRGTASPASSCNTAHAFADLDSIYGEA